MSSGSCVACGSCASSQSLITSCPGTTDTDVHVCSSTSSSGGVTLSTVFGLLIAFVFALCVIAVSAQTCTRRCLTLSEKPCGSDGCGGSCGNCTEGEECINLSPETPAMGCRNTQQCQGSAVAYNSKLNQAPTSEDLVLCSEYKDNTCCDANYVKGLQVPGIDCAFSDLSSACFYSLSLGKCMICNPDVGTGKIRPFACESYCEQVWTKCQGDRFSKYSFVDSSKQVQSFYFSNSDGALASEIFTTKEDFFLNTTLPYNLCSANAMLAKGSSPVTVTDRCFGSASSFVPSFFLLCLLAIILSL